VEIDGWRTRGSATFNPRGSVDHHTAGAARGNAPSLAICINGRADLPGPLCHVLVARDLTCYLIAAGRANHAGPGGWKGLSGNSSVYGVERENVGTPAEPWRAEQTAHAGVVHRALMNGKDAAFVCRHAEWAPNRKVDSHSVSGTQLRAAVLLQPKPPTEDDELMALKHYWLKDDRTTSPVAGTHLYGINDATKTGVYMPQANIDLAEYLSGGKFAAENTKNTPIGHQFFIGWHLYDGPLTGIKK
jgi:hypothetical protein